MRHLRLLLVAALAVIGLVVPGAVNAGGAVTQPLIGTVGAPSAPEAFTITLRDSTGAPISHLDPGTYAFVIRDYGTTHNFALRGPGVDQKTGVDETGTSTWTLTLSDGTYTFLCQAHPSNMRGTFTVGTVTKPPAPKKLAARVGPGRTISLKTAAGARVKTLKAGRYRITVKDSTRADNFHLIAPGANRKTGVRARGTQTWNVTFRAGKGLYRSDAHKRLRGSFTIR